MNDRPLATTGHDMADARQRPRLRGLPKEGPMLGGLLRICELQVPAAIQTCRLTVLTISKPNEIRQNPGNHARDKMTQWNCMLVFQSTRIEQPS